MADTVAGEQVARPDLAAEPLLAAVPQTATTVVAIDADGSLGAAVRATHPGCTVVDVHAGDLAAGLPSIGPGTVDCVVARHLVERLTDPLAVLRAARAWLAPNGTLACAVPNAGHHSVLVQLRRGALHVVPGGVLDAGTSRLYTYAPLLKLLLEAGFAPTIAGTVDDDAETADDGTASRDELVDAAAPLLDHLGISARQSSRHLHAREYVVTGTPLAVPDGPGRPVTFVACTNDAAQLHSNLLASPCLAPGHPHEVLLYEGMGSAAEGLNRGIREASNDLVVLLHQDVYLPSWWPAQLDAQWQLAEQDGPVALAGAFGVQYREGGRTNVGRVIDRDHLLAMDVALPATVDGLDEMLLVVPRSTPLRFDPALGWHLYGTDLALQAHRDGVRTAVLDLPCHHNSLLGGLDDSYGHSESVLARKWATDLPIVTNSSTIDRDPLTTEIAVLRDDLNAAHAEIAHHHQRAEEATQQLVEREAVIASMEASRVWKVRNVLNRLRGRKPQPPA
jgi:hypothetical protein